MLATEQMNTLSATVHHLTDGDTGEGGFNHACRSHHAAGGKRSYDLIAAEATAFNLEPLFRLGRQ